MVVVVVVVVVAIVVVVAVVVVHVVPSISSNRHITNQPCELEHVHTAWFKNGSSCPIFSTSAALLFWPSSTGKGFSSPSRFLEKKNSNRLNQSFQNAHRLCFSYKRPEYTLRHHEQLDFTSLFLQRLCHSAGRKRA